MITNEQQIRRAVQDIVQMAPKALINGYSWSDYFSIVKKAVGLEQIAKTLDKDEDRSAYFEQIKKQRDEIRALVRGKRPKRRK